MDNEIKFVSCKWVSQKEELLPDEEELWFFHIRNHLELDVDSADEFFNDVSEDFSTDELKIVRWEWKNHKILDMNSYPGDNECGTISFDGVPVIYNGDCDLAFIDDQDKFDFRDKLELFADMRISRMNNE